MTLLTRGKKEITFQIPDDTDESYAQYKSAVKHIAADRKDKDALAEKLSGKGFDGEYCSSEYDLFQACYCWKVCRCCRYLWPRVQNLKA